MIDLGATDFFIGVPSMPQHEFEGYSTRLFDEWEKYVGEILALPDYSLALEVEEGSVKGVGKIGVLLGALYLGIGNYGSFISGLQTIRGQVSSVGDFLAQRAIVPFESSGLEPKVRKRGGSLSHLQRLFNKVQSREMTAEQAMREAEILFGDEAVTAPEFMQKLQESFERTPPFPQQLPLLPLDTLEQEDLLSGSDKGRSPRPSRSKLSAPLPQQFRVEVWRESKKEQRRVRVIQL
jgi:hypothetical protein